MRVCVYCSSSARVATTYVQEARRLGEELALRGHELIYGGGDVGLMGILARAVHDRGGRVTGIIPEALTRHDIVYREADELVITETMAQRKGLMLERGEAFVALPGGFGTLEELSEALTLKQLGYRDAALVLLNTAGFYDRLAGFFDQLIALEFVRADHRVLYHLADDVLDALEYVENYRGCDLTTKWF
jgi:cytokinin riboside 5'-monophosphate phosphoribohydrolase